MNQLPVWTSPLKMGLCHAYSLLFDPIYLLVEELLSLVHGFLELMLPHLARTSRYGVGEWSLDGCGEHVCYVQLRVGALGHIGSGGEGQTSLLGAVGGQQDLRRKYAHRGCLLSLPSIPKHHDAISRSQLHLSPNLFTTVGGG